MTFVTYEARALMALLAILAAPQAAESQARPAPDTYTATTSEMTPDGLGLKIDVMAWSDAAARQLQLPAVGRHRSSGLTNFSAKRSDSPISR